MSIRVEAIALSIATFEGFFITGSLAQRNNNPGNLRSWGTMPVRDGYAAFPSADIGWAALRRQVQLNIDRGLTLQEFFGGKPGVYSGYAPAADTNNPTGYAAFVAERVGIPVNKPIRETTAPSSPSGSSPPATSFSQGQGQAPTSGPMSEAQRAAQTTPPRQRLRSRRPRS